VRKNANMICDKNKNNLCIIHRNPSGGSGLSETGSLDRAKAALERRKKTEDNSGNPILCRVEVTRPNPDSLIDELLKATNLEQTDLESSESTCFIIFFQSAIQVEKSNSYEIPNGELSLQEKNSYLISSTLIFILLYILLKNRIQ